MRLLFYNNRPIIIIPGMYIIIIMGGDTSIINVFGKNKGGGKGECERLLTRVSVIMICARCCSKRRRAFGFIMSSLREAFMS